MRKGGEARGNSQDRKARKLWLIKTYGNGETVACQRCNVTLTYATLTVERVIPGAHGGRYTRDNILPFCRPCNSSTGATIRKINMEV